MKRALAGVVLATAALVADRPLTAHHSFAAELPSE